MKSKIVLLLLVISTVIFLSGCIDMTIDSKVGRDGNLNHYNIKLEMDSMTYHLINEDGTFQELKEDVEQMGGTYRETWGQGTVTVISEFDNVNPEVIGVTSRIEDGYMVYENRLANDISQTAPGFTVTYYLEMPGTIIETNADLVSENNAQWNIAGPRQLDTIYAKSEIPTMPMPGASVLMLIIGIFGLVLIKYRN
ncbi:hypothetical protein [Methanosalsum natronophilum]|uniref:hypothetical protein n=1 Tax=Methanosalsum natronophilum TaxID=768733 RepID=UPI002168CA60|nr:hypothetical protein [Methanosalsum natronophilum]MCS3923915.1 hypothetical protein [Methanosalsum natronophilum]